MVGTVAKSKNIKDKIKSNTNYENITASFEDIC